MNAAPILQLDALVKRFPVKRGLFGPQKFLAAVNGVSLEIRPGETLALVGESGCGKSTVGKTIMKLHDPSEGRILIDGRDIAPLSRAGMKPVWRKVQTIFQDPFSSLNPRMSAGAIVGEPLTIHGLASGAEKDRIVAQTFRKVGLRPDQMGRFAHEFSGGQRQRLSIARALVTEPDLIIADEPVSALDVSIQASVINLLIRLQKEMGLAMLFISHDMSVVEHISHRVAVMYLGRLVESGPRDEIFRNPQHPYTRALLSAVPIADPAKRNRERIVLKGDVPSPDRPALGLSVPHPLPYRRRRLRDRDARCDDRLARARRRLPRSGARGGGLTIGIGAAGPNAGLAAFRALAAAEAVGRGSIGGFAVFAALTADSRLHRAETQRGGTATLFTEGEATGVPPPADIAAAPFAALISSGPDRPAPLTQFLAASEAGLVTGHRLPNAHGPDGRPVNAAVLAAMAEGQSAEQSLALVLDRDPEVDAGMIALGPGRGLAARNSRLVASRPDLGAATLTSGDAAVAVLHNAIRPAAELAPLVAAIALDILAPPHVVAGNAVIRAGTPVALAETHRVTLGPDGIATLIETTNARILSGRHACAAVYLGASVVQDGIFLGQSIMEPNVLVEDGHVLRLSGKTEVRIPYARTE